MNRVPLDKRTLILHMMVKGMSLRGIEEITGVSINTIMRLLLSVGQACDDFHNKMVAELDIGCVEVDEVWSYIHTKEDKLLPHERGTLHRGDSYTWLAIDPDTKLVVSYHVGKRTFADADKFIGDLSSRVNGPIQINSDGFMAYKPAIENNFEVGQIHYAQLHKVFAKSLENMSAADFLNKQRYTQPTLEATSKVVIFGDPDLERVSTSIIERHNRTVRMGIRRMGRAQEAFSKSYEHHKAAMSLMHIYYNFVHRHSTLRCTPAMEAGLMKTFMTMQQVAELEPAPVANRPKTYRKVA